MIQDVNALIVRYEREIAAAAGRAVRAEQELAECQQLCEALQKRNTELEQQTTDTAEDGDGNADKGVPAEPGTEASTAPDGAAQAKARRPRAGGSSSIPGS